MTRPWRVAAILGVALFTSAAMARLAQQEDWVAVQLLAINDFHGALEPAEGGTGRIAGIDAGGVEYLAAHVARLRRENPNTIVVAAGDNIGGTPFLSSLFHDEPTIEALNLIDLDVSALGNHELDDGWWELYRIQRGGCHPVDGCQDGTPFDGAAFTYLAANVTLHPANADPEMLELARIAGPEPRLLLPAFTVRQVGGVRIGFIGLVLQGTPAIVVPGSVRGLTFGPEPEAANAAAEQLLAEGVRAIVVLIHEGGEQRGGINGCEGLSRRFADLVARMSDAIDVVVSGHTHQSYNCRVAGKIVTSASSSGRVLTDIDLRIRRSDGEVVGAEARNLIVTRDVPRDRAQSVLLARYQSIGDEVGNRIVGTITASMTRTTNDAGESTLGNIVADALLDAATRTPGAAADLAIWNPGGIRDDLPARPGGGPTPVTYAQVFAVLPFGNDLITKTITGAVLLQMLEEQFGVARTRIMQVSRSLTYAYDPSRPRGERVVRESVRVNGLPLELDRTYRLATSNFLWDAGDGLSALAAGTDPVLVGTDHELLADYLSRRSPAEPVPLGRIRRLR